MLQFLMQPMALELLSNFSVIWKEGSDAGGRWESRREKGHERRLLNPTHFDCVVNWCLDNAVYILLCSVWQWKQSLGKAALGCSLELQPEWRFLWAARKTHERAASEERNHNDGKKISKHQQNTGLCEVWEYKENTNAGDTSSITLP